METYPPEIKTITAENDFTFDVPVLLFGPDWSEWFDLDRFFTIADYLGFKVEKSEQTLKVSGSVCNSYLIKVGETGIKLSFVNSQKIWLRLTTKHHTLTMQRYTYRGKFRFCVGYYTKDTLRKSYYYLDDVQDLERRKHRLDEDRLKNLNVLRQLMHQLASIRN